jgi:hypothetical protein
MDPQPIFMALRKNQNTFTISIDTDSWSGAPDTETIILTKEGVEQVRNSLDADWDYIRFADEDGVEYAIRRNLVRQIRVQPN